VGIVDFGGRIARNAWRLPIVGSILERDYARSFHQGRELYRGAYATFAEAEASIPPGEAVGYDHAALAGMYRDRMSKACQSDYAVLYWLRRILEPTSVV
jgi:hypothetical protein